MEPKMSVHQAHRRRLRGLCAQVLGDGSTAAAPASGSAETARLNVAGTGTTALGPDPWTNTPDGKGSGRGPLPPRLVMTDEELYLFDLHGYLVVPQVLSQETVASLNQHIDDNLERVHTRGEAGSLDGRDEPIHGGVAAPAMTGSHGRGDFGGFLWDWGEPAGVAFRALIANEHAMRIVIGVIGDAFRLASVSGLSQSKGAEGFVLHGGGNPDNMFASMRERDFHRWEPTPFGGRMRNGLLRVGFALTDALSENDGGFCCIPGSHKAMYEAPIPIKRLESATDEANRAMRHVPTKKGDMFVFTEALTHGTLPWHAEHERRTLYFLYQPFYAGGNMQPTDEQLATLGDVEAALMEPGQWTSHPQSIGRLMTPRVQN